MWLGLQQYPRTTIGASLRPCAFLCPGFSTRPASRRPKFSVTFPLRPCSTRPSLFVIFTTLTSLLLSGLFVFRTTFSPRMRDQCECRPGARPRSSGGVREGCSSGLATPLRRCASAAGLGSRFASRRPQPRVGADRTIVSILPLPGPFLRKPRI